MNRLTLLLFALSIVHSFGATITGTLKYATNNVLSTNIVFIPLSTPVGVPPTVYEGTPVTNRTAVDGTFSLSLAAGRYRVWIATVPSQQTYINVPEGDESYTLASLLTNSLTMSGSGALFVLKNNGFATNLTAKGSITFGGETRTNWPTGSGTASNAIANLNGFGTNTTITNLSIRGSSTLQGSLSGIAGSYIGAESLGIGLYGSGINESDQIVTLWNTWTGTHIDIDSFNSTNADSAVRYIDLTNYTFSKAGLNDRFILRNGGYGTNLVVSNVTLLGTVIGGIGAVDAPTLTENYLVHGDTNDGRLINSKILTAGTNIVMWTNGNRLYIDSASSVSNANVMYVSKTGDNSTALPGRADKPYADLGTAMSNAPNNTVIIVGGGRWTNHNQVYSLAGAGHPAYTITNRTNITIRGESPETTVLIGTNRGDTMLIYNCSGILIEKLGFEGWAWNGEQDIVDVSAAINYVQVDNLTIERCRFIKGWDWAIMENDISAYLPTQKASTNGIVIRKCYAEQFGYWYPAPSTRWDGGFWAGSCALVEENETYECNQGAEIYPVNYTANLQCPPSIIRKNTFRECSSSGAAVGKTDAPAIQGAIIEGNYVVADLQHTFRGGSNYLDSQSGILADLGSLLIIRGNTVKGPYNGIRLQCSTAHPMTNNVIEGNTIIGSGPLKGGITLYADGAGGIKYHVGSRIANNVVIGTGADGIGIANGRECEVTGNLLMNCCTNAGNGYGLRLYLCTNMNARINSMVNTGTGAEVAGFQTETAGTNTALGNWFQGITIPFAGSWASTNWSATASVSNAVQTVMVWGTNVVATGATNINFIPTSARISIVGSNDPVHASRADIHLDVNRVWTSDMNGGGYGLTNASILATSGRFDNAVNIADDLTANGLNVTNAGMFWTTLTASNSITTTGMISGGRLKLSGYTEGQVPIWSSFLSQFTNGSVDATITGTNLDLGLNGLYRAKTAEGVLQFAGLRGDNGISVLSNTASYLTIEGSQLTNNWLSVWQAIPTNKVVFSTNTAIHGITAQTNNSFELRYTNNVPVAGLDSNGVFFADSLYSLYQTNTTMSISNLTLDGLFTAGTIVVTNLTNQILSLGTLFLDGITPNTMAYWDADSNLVSMTYASTPGQVWTATNTTGSGTWSNATGGTITDVDAIEAGTLLLTNQIDVSCGGTGLETITNNALLVGNGTNPPIQLISSATEGQVLASGASGVLVWTNMSGGSGATNWSIGNTNSTRLSLVYNATNNTGAIKTISKGSNVDIVEEGTNLVISASIVGGAASLGDVTNVVVSYVTSNATNLFVESSTFHTNWVNAVSNRLDTFSGANSNQANTFSVAASNLSYAIGTAATNYASGTANNVSNWVNAVSNRLDSFSTANSNLSYAIGTASTNYAAGTANNVSNWVNAVSNKILSVTVQSVGSNGVIYAATNINFVGNGKMTNVNGLISIGLSSATNFDAIYTGSLILTNPIDVAFGGTGITNITNNAILVGNGTNPPIQLKSSGTEGQVLASGASGVLVWTNVAAGSLGDILAASNSLYIVSSNVSEALVNYSSNALYTTSSNIAVGYVNTASNALYGTSSNIAVGYVNTASNALYTTSSNIAVGYANTATSNVPWHLLATNALSTKQESNSFTGLIYQGYAVTNHSVAAVNLADDLTANALIITNSISVLGQVTYSRGLTNIWSGVVTNLVVNFNCARVTISMTNGCTMTNFAGLEADQGTTTKYLDMLLVGRTNAMPQVTLPTFGGNSYGIHLWTNANNPVCVLITNNTRVRYTWAAEGTNVSLISTVWF